MLASLWPSLTFLHNEVAEDALARDSLAAWIQDVAIGVDTIAGSLSNAPNASDLRAYQHAASQLHSSLDSLSERIHRVERVLRNSRKATSATLPWSWAAAFFSALAVALGNLIYQVRAPKRVRDFDELAYIQSEVENYARQPTLARVQHAYKVVGPPDVPMPMEDVQADLPYIEEAARREYRRDARTAPFSAVAAGLLYLAAILLLLLIITRQAARVAEAANWFS